MIGKFVYSLNGSEYQGESDTRQGAVIEALAAARRMDPSPSTVYVGRAVAPDAMAGGHARAVLSHMVARAREEAADGGASYLAKVPKAQLDELDAALENTILGWLAKHQILPTYFRVESISEHTVPPTSEKREQRQESEVFDLGVADSVNQN